MLVIYNLGGLLLGLAGAVAGIVVAAASGYMSLGVAAMGAVWVAFGWPRMNAETGRRKPFPSIYFIPLPFAGMAVMLCAGLLFLTERRMHNEPPDPRAAAFKQAEDDLRLNAVPGDKPALEGSIRKKLIAATATDPTKTSDYHVLTRVSPGAVLVLAQVPNLKSISETDRFKLLDMIEGELKEQNLAEGRMKFIGIKGPIAYGAVRIPPSITKTDRVISKTLLYPFFSSANAPTTSSAQEESPASQP